MEALWVYSFLHIWEILSHCFFKPFSVPTLHCCVNTLSPLGRPGSSSGVHLPKGPRPDVSVWKPQLHSFVFCRYFMWETKSGLYYSILSRSGLLMVPKEAVQTLLEALGLE